MPGFAMDPSLRLTKGAPPFAGSKLGMIHGLTQRGFTGTMPLGATAPDAEELKASAVAVALTLFGFRDQMRENKVGRPPRMTCTCTCGFTPKAFAPAKVQFATAVPLYTKFTFTVVGAVLPTAFWFATAWATCVAVLQAVGQFPVVLSGSPVTPLRDRTRAAASAAASAERCASSRAR